MDKPLQELSDLPRVGDRTYEAIREAIVSGSLAPGTKLTVDHLAHRLGVSRTPVKEALVRLEREGLVRIVPRHGAFVARLSVPDVEELYDLREVCEGLAARRAAMHARREQLAELEELLARAEQCVRSQDRVRYSDVDVLFHGAIARMSGNGRLVEVLEGLRSQTRLLMAASVVLPGRLQRSHQEHRRIYEAIAGRDPRRAEAAARAHVRAVRRAVLAHLNGAQAPGEEGGSGGGI